MVIIHNLGSFFIIFIMIITTKLRDIVLSIIIVAITISSTIIFTSNKASAHKTTETTPKLGITVALDAGHGGSILSIGDQIFKILI